MSSSPILLREIALALFIVSLLAVSASATSVTRAVAESRYSHAHSLGDSYSFDPRDGWHSVNVSNLPYKYEPRALEPRSARKKPKGKGKLGGLGKLVSASLKGLKGIGKPQEVKITWYTGHDLENPSCWANGHWAPTDNSFACALTLEGWTTRPQCFKFLELCNSPKKCVFVRVVDTCAGCAKGAHHVDLTRAAFGQLANFDEGTLGVQMRLATEPDAWLEDLWGPKQGGK